jgi:hypothetical protein
MTVLASWMFYLRVVGALAVVTVLIAAVVDLLVGWWQRCR